MKPPRFQGKPNSGIDALGIGLAGNPDIHDRAALRCNDVRAQPAVDRADIHGDAAGRIVEREQLLDYIRELQYRAHAPLWVETRVCCPAFDRDRVPSDALTRRL